MAKTALLPVDIDNLLLNENAYFFKVRKKISKTALLGLFKDSLEDKNGTRKYKQVIRAPFFDGPSSVARYSLDIFQFSTKPSFLKEHEQGKLEVKYGLLLIVEFSDYLAIIRKNISGIKDLNQYVEAIDYEVLTHFVITQNSKFEKIVSSNMNTAVSAVQNKTAEAIDLQGIYSRFGASKQILNSLRVDNIGEKFNISLNTSRVNSFQLKGDFNHVVLWMIDMLKLINRAYSELPSSPFIDGFATPIKFESIIKDLIPTFLLFRFSYLKEDIDKEFIQKCYVVEDDAEVDYDLKTLLNQSEYLIPIGITEDDEYKADDFHIRINQKSITVRSDEFDRVLLDFGQESPTSLTQYMNYGNHFIINFDHVDYVYSHKKIFKDSRLLGDIENFLTTFIPFQSLNDTQSEKGLNYTENSTNFENDSLFGFIENELVGDQTNFLICDDMGVEWGDFISVSDDDICFYHAKFSEHGLSASKLEEVFGQAAKNFGSLELNDSMINYRSERWIQNYRLNGVNTSISRVRIPEYEDDIIERLKEAVQLVSASGNLRRKVFIVINFLSKNELTNAVNRVKAGDQFDHKGVTLQILWFVNSLLSSANELNTELRIICRP